MEDEEVREDSKPTSVTCIRCGRPMDPRDPCDCNELVFVYWEI